MCCRAVTIGSVISMYVSYLRDAMFVCFHVFVKWVVWYSGLLWLVIFAVVSRCDKNPHISIFIGNTFFSGPSSSMRTDRWMERNDEANSRFSQFRERTKVKQQNMTKILEVFFLPT